MSILSEWKNSNASISCEQVDEKSYSMGYEGARQVFRHLAANVSPGEDLCHKDDRQCP